MNSFLQDLRYAVRMLVKSPAFTAIAILTLALGIGANTALFSVVNGVLLNPLPYPHPEQLVTIHESKPNFRTGSISYPNFLDWERDNQTFSAMAVHRQRSFSLTGLGDAEQVGAEFVTPDFFPILGVNPVLGRDFSASDDKVGAAPVALISQGFWKRKFGSGPDIVGKSLTLDGRGFTVVGIIPASFDLTLGSFNPSEVYLPVVQWSNDLLFNRGAGLGFHGIGRLKPGVTIERASADMDAVTRNLAAAYPNVDKGISAALIPLRTSIIGRIEPYLLVLSCAVGFVLLIACVNIANLLLVRSTGRAREFAVRATLGAGKARLVRQLLTESVLLSFIGGALGLMLANWGTQAALGVLPITLPRSGEVRLDPRVLLFTASITVLCGILFGLFPALKLSGSNLHESLKEGGRGASGVRQRAHGTLVVIETALALLVGAGLMLRSLVGLWGINPGFDPQNVLTFGFSMPPSMLKASLTAIRAAFREADRTILSTPGVEAVSMSWGAFPLSGDDEWLFWLDGHPKPKMRDDMNWTLEYVVDPDYLKVMRISLHSGRFLTTRDDENAPRVVVVDDVFARQYFGSENPIGKRVFLETGDGDFPAEIVGTVGHVKQWGLDTDDTEKLHAQLYFPFMQLPDSELAPTGIRVVLRSNGRDSAVFDAVRRSLQHMNAEQVVYGVQTMDEIMSTSIANRKFSMILLGSFAGLSLLLSSIGIYGVISYLVGQQTREIGIRIALGAQRRDVLQLVLSTGVKMALIGVAIGLVASFGLTRLMADLLYGVTATDPLTFAAVALLLIGVALAACYLPARRAMRVDPLVALRYE